MSCDRQEYIRLCASMKLKPQSVLENALAKSELTGCLNLAGITLSTTTCKILGKLISTSTVLRKLDVSNSMLPSLGASHILSGLSKNTSITDADLSSNNLQTNTAMKIGALLRQTTTLKRLFLQWNSLGSDRDSFGVFCDGLGVNESIEEIDLRNNQLGPWAVRELASACRSNKTLKTLDLRWNSLGPGDGRELLNAVQANSQLSSLQLDGNQFNTDLSLAIEQAATHNGEIAQLAQEWQARCAQLARHSAQLEQREGQRASGVRFLLQHQGQKLGSLARERQDELVRAEAQLATSRKRAATLESLLRDKDEQIETLQEMNQGMQLDRDKETTELEGELREARGQLEKARQLVQTLQAHSAAQHDDVERLKRESAELQEKLVLHNAKCADVVKAAEERALAAVHRVRQERAAAEERLRRAGAEAEQQVERLERARMELEAQLAAGTQAHSEALAAAREQAAQHEAERVSMLQAAMAALMTEKGALGSELEGQRALVERLREEEEVRRQELARQNELVAQLRQELSREGARCSALQAQVAEAAGRREDAARLEVQMARVQDQLARLQGEREEQVRQLTNIVATQERHIATLRVDEAERTGLLCSAVTQYLARVGAAAGMPSQPSNPSS